jgi:hypothetical protein
MEIKNIPIWKLDSGSHNLLKRFLVNVPDAGFTEAIRHCREAEA